jgi:predicted HTH transcriptional regulator
MDLDQILAAADIGESSDLEFKSAQGGFPGSFWETYSGMGNTEGGIVILGIKERDSRFTVEGLNAEQISNYQKILWDSLNNPSRVNRNLLSPKNVEVVNISGKSLLSIEIPRAGRFERPIYIGMMPFGNTYRRCHQGDYRCSDDQVRRMFADASSVPSDHRILKGFTLEDLDSSSLDQYKRRFSSSKPNHPWLLRPIQQFLEMLGRWRKDRELGEEGITLAALLMFGRHHSITDIGKFPFTWKGFNVSTIRLFTKLFEKLLLMP